MRSAYKLLSHLFRPHRSPVDLFFSASTSSGRHPRLDTSPSFSRCYQNIMEIISFHSVDNNEQSTSSTQHVRQNACENKAKAQKEGPDLEEVSSIVHKITSVIRSEACQVPMENRLDELAFVYTHDIVEKVLKRCFKVGHLAIRFFNWVKQQRTFCHSTETYNTMIYIAGEAGEFDLVEKLMKEMDAEFCSKDIKTWTILISQYMNAKKIAKALFTFEEMRKSSCKTDSGLYEAMLKGLFSMKETELAFEFYKEMVLKEMKVDIKIYAMLMECLASSGDVSNARLVGEDMMKIAELPKTEVQTLMLKSFCISGKVDEAMELFEEMKNGNQSVDSNAYEVLLKGLCRAGKMDEALKIVDAMKHSFTVDNRFYRCLIDGFLRIGKAWKSLELLRSMIEHGCLPSVFSYTQVIQHLFRSNQYKKACELYEEMIQNNIEIDMVAITAVVAGHVQHNNISEAWKVFNVMKRNGMVPTWKAYSIFIKELCKASMPNEALRLLSEMSSFNIKPTDHIFRLVISSLLRNGEFEKARIAEQQCKSFRLNYRESQQLLLPKNQPFHEEKEEEGVIGVCKESLNTYDESEVEELCGILSSVSNSDLLLKLLNRSTITFTPALVEEVLRRSQRHGCAALLFFSWVGTQLNYKHTTETYNMAVKIAGSGKDFRHMRILYHEMKRRRCTIEPNTWTIMISQYGQAGLTEIALNTFKEMKAEGFHPNGSTFKYLIVFLCENKRRKVEEAIKIFHEMLASGYMPDRKMVDIFLSCLCESGMFIEASRAVKLLCKKGFKNQICYSLLIKSLCRTGSVEKALIFIDEFEKLGCKLDQFIYASIIHALLRKGRLKEALNKVKAMKNEGFSESVYIRTSLIVHFCKRKKIKKAMEIFDKMRQEGLVPTIFTYSALICGFTNMRMFSDAWKIFNQMKVNGLLPDFKTYSIFMDCLCKQERSEDAFKLLCEMMEREIIPSAINFTTVYHGLNREGKQELARSVLKMKWGLKRERVLPIEGSFNQLSVNSEFGVMKRSNLREQASV